MPKQKKPQVRFMKQELDFIQRPIDKWFTEPHKAKHEFTAEDITAKLAVMREQEARS